MSAAAIVELINTEIFGVWFLMGAAMVFFMQCGFAMVETGFARAKNAGNIIMKNVMDFCIGTVMFVFLGFSLMMSENYLFGFIGVPDLMIFSNFEEFISTNASSFVFNLVFCATAATIVSGAMAERTKFSAYCIYSIVISCIIYPISGHWIWSWGGEGWLQQLGFHDFAGSTAVHMVGGICALIGAKILGPRIGKYGKDGKPRAILGHSLTLGALGVFILWFCWFGFNGGSTVSASGGALTEMGEVFMTTNLAACTAAISTMCITWVRYKKPDVSMTLNGALAGLVAITAGCDMVSPLGAAIIGVIAGFAVVFGIEFVDKKLKIDDPVGAVGVHCINGALGTILTGFFAVDGGVFYGGGFRFLGIQVLGVLAVAAWVTVTISIVFFIIKKTVGLRVSAAEEIAGLDIEEHGLASSYADFMPSSMPSVMTSSEKDDAAAGVTPVDAAVPVQVVSGPAGTVASDVKMSKVVILCKQSKFEALKAAMTDIGITGMTVTQVLGCGIQKGRSEYYRGVEVELNLLPKIKVEIVVCKVPVRDVILAAKTALYTGHIGDGKIFVYDVEQVVKVRTGEENYDALQDLEEGV